MDTGFALLLGAALVASMLMGLWQYRAYTGAARRLQNRYAGRDRHYLVSGRARGPLRGAIVLLVIDAGTKTVVNAEAMVGASALARFRPRPELEGSVSGLQGRTGDEKLREALRGAVEQYRLIRKGGSAARPADMMRKG
ncbi:transcriptional regulator GutM [Sediminivirga luteola]|uniref:Glucitol operon activator protein n=1 Tax=Sediminivirga luteola TaxID=1774748 RepID=A0A8J2TVD3_9MICO|nr:transcriptional regulator GutM [Sediminivirga luteola]MCI2264563.1 transcriptional regulator GutM [Sediminivirga luteola]GGA03361.1 hypothetical protein GCM10011333_02580 [Sediminivirga luteola]